MNRDYIPIAALNHYAYCPHRCWRMFCAGEFQENEYTIEGTSLHDRAHTLSETQRGETWQVRAIWLKSEAYHLIGKADLIEVKQGEVYPVEYKRGKPNQWINDALQVCAQALCLEEMTGKPIKTGFLYYAQTHQRETVAISSSLREEAKAIINALQQLFQTGERPKPVYTPRCRGCSLYAQCLPQVSKKLKTYEEV